MSKDNWLAKEVGKKIKAMRIKKDLSQESFAQMINLTRNSVINIESGRHKPPIDTLYIMCCIFGCMPNDLFPSPKNIPLKHSKKTIIKKVVKHYYKPITL